MPAHSFLPSPRFSSLAHTSFDNSCEAPNRHFETPGLHCRSADSGELRFKSKQTKKRICRVPPHSRIPRSTTPTGTNRLCQIIGFKWMSPESGDLWHKSMQLKKTICSRSEGVFRRRVSLRSRSPRSAAHQIVSFGTLNMHCTSPDSSALQYRCRG